MAQDTTLYIGRPGALESIRLPRGGVTATRVRQSAVYQLAGGGARGSRLVSGKRQYSIAYQALDYASFSTLLAYEQGHNGPGPFALLDPGQRNMLTVNQSAATGLSNDTDNFSVAGSGGTITSDATVVHRGPRSLKWSFAVTNPASAVLSLDPPAADWPGIPCAIRPHSFGFVMQGGGTDAIVNLQAQFTYLNSAGASIGTSAGSVATSSGAAWTTVKVEGVTPVANTAFIQCQAVGVGSTISAGGFLSLSEFMFNEGATLDAWSPGTGIPPVIPLSLGDQQPGYFTNYRTSASLVLQEVGA